MYSIRVALPCLLVCVFVGLYSTAFSMPLFGQTITRPHLPLSGNNLVNNGQFLGQNNWSVNNGALYDVGVSRGLNTGSIQLPPSTLNIEPKVTLTTKIPVVPGETYTVSLFVKSDVAGAPIHVTPRSWGNCPCVNTDTGYSTKLYRPATLYITQQANVWEEVVLRYHAPLDHTPPIEDIDLSIRRGNALMLEGISTVWIDDVHIEQAEGYQEAPTPRDGFNGNLVRTDALGNWQVMQAEAWVNFFPFGLYSLRTEAYQAISDAGFNVVLSQQFTSQILIAKASVSSYNPQGLFSCKRLAKYAGLEQQLAAGTENYVWTIEQLASSIEDIYLQNAETALLCYDWDHENIIADTSMSHYQTMINTVKTQGGNDHPVYILQGTHSLAKGMDSLSDALGTYINLPNNYSSEGIDYNQYHRVRILQNQHDLSTPYSIAQINAVFFEPWAFRERVYQALIEGARGIFWWGDNENNVYSGIPGAFVEDTPWFSDVPNLREEIDALMPVIRSPNWTDWSISCDTNQLLVGSREVDGDGYLLILNTGDSEIASTCLITGLIIASQTLELIDYFDAIPNGSIQRLGNGDLSLQISVAAHSSKVLMIQNAKSIPALPSLALIILVASLFLIRRKVSKSLGSDTNDAYLSFRG